MEKIVSVMKTKFLGEGEVINFNFNSIDFRRLFEEELGPISSWDKIFLKENRQDVESRLYKVIKSKNFLASYKLLLDFLINSVSEEYEYQAIPSLRIQLPGDKAAVFHIDSFTGHGKDLINFWLPITNLEDTNTLWIVDKQNTQSILQTLSASDNLSVSSLDAEARKRSTPCLLEYGKILIFSNKTLHGCITNLSQKTRVSIDFRALPLNSSAGTKCRHKLFAYPPNTIHKQLTEVNSIVYCNHKATHISHEAQRGVIEDFCDKNDFTIMREDSDWHGYGEQLPLIKEWAKSYPNMPMVIFSKLCFDLDCPKTYKSLVNAAQKMECPIYFALESEEFTCL